VAERHAWLSFYAFAVSSQIERNVQLHYEDGTANIRSAFD